MRKVGGQVILMVSKYITYECQHLLTATKANGGATTQILNYNIILILLLIPNIPYRVIESIPHYYVTRAHASFTMKDTVKKEIDADIKSLNNTLASITTLDGLTAVLSIMTSKARAEKESKDVSFKYTSLISKVEDCQWETLSGGKFLFTNPSWPP